MRNNLKWTAVILLFFVLPEFVGRIVEKYLVKPHKMPPFYWGTGILTLAAVAAVIYVIKRILKKIHSQNRGKR